MEEKNLVIDAATGGRMTPIYLNVLGIPCAP